MAPAADEADLIRGAQALDEDAWSELYARHREKIYAFVLLRIGDRHAAEDLTAEVFLRAVRGIKRYQWRGAPISAWLYRIAQNVTIDHRKSLARRSAHESRQDAFDVRERTDHIAVLDDRRDMHAAIRMLTDEQQQVLLLRFYAGLSTEEISVVMKKRPSAVKALQARGLRSLGRVLAEGGRAR
jgi:RNA polymerase sigma-70 factor, ECF subfamily